MKRVLSLGLAVFVLCASNIGVGAPLDPNATSDAQWQAYLSGKSQKLPDGYPTGRGAVQLKRFDNPSLGKGKCYINTPVDYSRKTGFVFSKSLSSLNAKDDESILASATMDAFLQEILGELKKEKIRKIPIRKLSTRKERNSCLPFTSVLFGLYAASNQVELDVTPNMPRANNGKLEIVQRENVAIDEISLSGNVEVMGEGVEVTREEVELDLRRTWALIKAVLAQKVAVIDSITLSKENQVALIEYARENEENVQWISEFEARSRINSSNDSIEVQLGCSLRDRFLGCSIPGTAADEDRILNAAKAILAGFKTADKAKQVEILGRVMVMDPKSGDKELIAQLEAIREQYPRPAKSKTSRKQGNERKNARPVTPEEGENLDEILAMSASQKNAENGSEESAQDDVDTTEPKDDEAIIRSLISRILTKQKHDTSKRHVKTDEARNVNEIWKEPRVEDLAFLEEQLISPAAKKRLEEEPNKPHGVLLNANVENLILFITVTEFPGKRLEGKERYEYLKSLVKNAQGKTRHELLKARLDEHHIKLKNPNKLDDVENISRLVAAFDRYLPTSLVMALNIRALIEETLQTKLPHLTYREGMIVYRQSLSEWWDEHQDKYKSMYQSMKTIPKAEMTESGVYRTLMNKVASKYRPEFRRKAAEQEERSAVSKSGGKRKKMIE